MYRVQKWYTGETGVSTMRCNMCFKILPFIESFITNVTFEPVLTSVNEQVIPIGLFFHKGLRAVIAIFQTFVASHMAFVMIFDAKSFSAYLTIIFKLSSMNFHMLIQVTFLGISFVTLTACMLVSVFHGLQCRRLLIPNFVAFDLHQEQTSY